MTPAEPGGPSARRYRGITLSELLGCLLSLLCGVLAASYVAVRFGRSWGWLGFPLGVVVGIVLLLFLALLSDLGERWKPPLPVCRQGLCKWFHYRGVERTERGWIYECGCGFRYLQRDRRFLVLLADGTERRYMRHSLFGRWRADEHR